VTDGTFKHHTNHSASRGSESCKLVGLKTYVLIGWRARTGDVGKCWIRESYRDGWLLCVQRCAFCSKWLLIAAVLWCCCSMKEGYQEKEDHVREEPQICLPSAKSRTRTMSMTNCAPITTTTRGCPSRRSNDALVQGMATNQRRSELQRFFRTRFRDNMQ